jgi:hypothetical protein
MTRLSILLAAVIVAGAGLLTGAPKARAGGDLEHGRRADDSGQEQHDSAPPGDSCIAGVRATGRGWLFKSAARLSAIRAWEREVRYVHGEAYAFWNSARDHDIECKHVNAIFQKCEARANPCRS